MKNIKRKKGIAIELALLALVFIFGLSTLLTGIIIASKNTKQRALNDLTEKTTLMQIVQSDDYLPVGYVKQTENNTIKVYKNENLLLTVTLENGVIVNWVYSL